MHYIGIDVSKHKLDCLWLRDAEAQKVKTKVFKNTSEHIQALAAWLLKNTEATPDEIFIVMEATSVYHELAAHALFNQGFNISVVNPARPKSFAKSLGNLHKTDLRDSHILALFGYKMTPESWQPEAQEVRQLKALLSRLDALEQDLQREQNRLEKAEITAVSELIMESISAMIQALKSEIKKLEQEIDDHIDKHPVLKNDRALLETIPGVAKVVSRLMLSVLHSRKFTKAGQVAAFAGLIPVQNESGVFRGRSRLSKQGSAKLRAKLYMPAVVAIQHNPDLKAHYQRMLGNNKSRMQSLCGVMRKLIHICFGVLKNQTEYLPRHEI